MNHASGITRTQAIELLTEMAQAIVSGYRPVVSYDAMEAIISNSVCVEVSSLKHESEFLFREGQSTENVNLARGVAATLDAGKSLLRLTFTPEKFEQGRRLMSIVGIVKGDLPDVAERHDDYLVDAYMTPGA